VSEAAAWEAFVDEIEPHVSPEWTKNARAHGGQGWIRLIMMVDVHTMLTGPQIMEKIAMTMADLADSHEKAEVAGWGALHDQAKERRRELLNRIVEIAPDVLTPELQMLFTRSLVPVPEFT
jgi:hypothetical protein